MAELLAVSPEILIDIAGGSVGGFCSKALDYPFDSAKVLLQTQPKDAPIKYKGTFDCLQQSVQQKGWTSLYNGVGSRLLGSMAENAVCFLSYASIKRELLRQAPQLQQKATSTNRRDAQRQRQQYLMICSLAGAGSGVCASFVMTPIELVKCRLQVSAQLANPLYKNSTDCFLQTVRSEGLQGLYRGHLSTMYREVPGNFFWYLTYELACDGLVPFCGTSRDDLPASAHMAAGGLAGVMYWAAIYPADTVKSLLQTTTTSASAGEIAVPTSFRQALTSMYQEQGLRGLYRGFGVTAIRAAPANAVLFAGYEKTQTFLKKVM